MGRRRRAEAAVLWSIAIYIRLSREDGGDGESRSVSNQRAILAKWLEEHFDQPYRIVDVYCDDGLSGTDTSRREFQRMLGDIEAGLVNCVLVKNLNRLFRNYADQGYYLESYFPERRVRFVSLGGPAFDSHQTPDEVWNSLELPINAVLHDRYVASTSREVRRTFREMAKRGEALGGFAPYGYTKDPENPRRFLVDREAAAVVGEIYRWYVLEGLSKTGIAKKLNGLGVPNPAKHKQQQGLRYRNSHPGNSGLWSAATVGGILKNPVYTGSMVLGRQQVLNHKSHKVLSLPEEAWQVVPNRHPAIVDAGTFARARALAARDTRTAPGAHRNYLFSGFLRCAGCGRALTRRSNRWNVYYACRTHKEMAACPGCSIREDRLGRAVLAAVRSQLGLAEGLAERAQALLHKPAAGTGGLARQQEQRRRELTETEAAAGELYLDWKRGRISEAEFQAWRRQFEQKAARLRESLDALAAELRAVEAGSSRHPELAQLAAGGPLTQLNWGLLAALVDCIYLHPDQRITIQFAFPDPREGDRQ